jgi:hypothetical protein
MILDLILGLKRGISEMQMRKEKKDDKRVWWWSVVVDLLRHR